MVVIDPEICTSSIVQGVSNSWKHYIQPNSLPRLQTARLWSLRKAHVTQRQVTTQLLTLAWGKRKLLRVSFIIGWLNTTVAWALVVKERERKMFSLSETLMQNCHHLMLAHLCKCSGIVFEASLLKEPSKFLGPSFTERLSAANTFKAGGRDHFTYEGPQTLRKSQLGARADGDRVCCTAQQFLSVYAIPPFSTSCQRTEHKRNIFQDQCVHMASREPDDTESHMKFCQWPHVVYLAANSWVHTLRL